MDRPSDAVSCPSDNCSELPERTRSNPLILRLARGVGRVQTAKPPPRCCAVTTGLCGQGQDPCSPRPADAPEAALRQAQHPGRRASPLCSRAIRRTPSRNSDSTCRYGMAVDSSCGQNVRAAVTGAVCEGHSPAHAPRGRAANGRAGPSSTGPAVVGSPRGGTGRTARGSPHQAQQQPAGGPQETGLRRPGGNTVLARESFTHIEAGSSSADGKTQGAFLFYGPKDLGKEASVQDTWLRDGRQGLCP